ncbi:MAG: PQQ-binding-like beta-propeller repeat protein [Planctomycetota bacterium]
MSDLEYQADTGAQATSSDTSGSRRRRIRNHRVLGFVGLIVGLGVLAYLQLQAETTDYQRAFIQSSIAAGLTLAWVGFHFQRSMALSGRRWRLPITLVVVVAVAATIWKVDTLSGEMIPQLRWRFASVDVPPLRALQDTGAVSGDNDSIDTEPPAAMDDRSLAIDPSAEMGIDWPSFLGAERDGVVARRRFEIPQSVGDVQERWNIGIGEGWSSFAATGDLAVTLEQRDDLECVTAYDVNDGTLVWKVDHNASHFHPLGQGGPRSTPAIWNQRVYAQGATGQLWCLDLYTGRVHWSHDLIAMSNWSQDESESAIAWGRAGSPLIVDGMCVVPLGGPEEAANEGRSLIAFDAMSGDIVWRAGSDQISYASPQVMLEGQDRQIVSVNETTITGHQISTGLVLWSFDWFGRSNSGANCAAAMPAGDRRFLIGKGYGGGSALVEIQAMNDQWTATPSWTSNRVLKTKFNHAVVRDGIAYGINNGALQAVQVDTGEPLWQQPRRSRCGQGQVILAEDVLLVQAEDGEVILVEATGEDYREWLRIDALHHKTWNIPTLFARTLLVRNDRQAIAIELPPRR